MRERLFKGFHPTEQGDKTILLNKKQIKGEWVYGDLTHRCYGGRTQSYIREMDAGVEWYILSETVCEYVKDDCKGNKVFENDIVKIDYTDLEVGLIKITGQIVWNKDIGGYLIHERAYCRNYDIRYHEEMEVVGNAFDRPNF